MAESATSDQTKEQTNKVEITDAGPSLKRLSIEVPAETVAERMAESMDTLIVEATLPGFRKGRVPRKLLERKFGSSMREEAKKQLVASAYSDAVERNGLKVIGEPSSEMLEDVTIEEGQPLKFEIEVEVLPEFELPGWDGLKIDKPMFEVTDETIDEEIKKISINDGELEQQTTAGKDDYLTGHGVMTGADGTEFYNIPGAVIQMPATKGKGAAGMVLGIQVDDLGSQLGKPAPGETATIKATGPENHEIEGVRGAELTIAFKVDRIDRIIPAGIEALCSQYGLENEAEFREMVRTRIEQRIHVRQHVAMRQQVARHLVESAKIDLPERMTTTQAARTFERRRMELMYRGVDQTQIEENIAELRAASSQDAANELKLFFILNKAADEMDVKVQEAEVNGRIAEMALEQGVRPEKLRQDLIQSNRIGSIAQQIREHKTMDAILEKAEIREVSAEDYAKSAAGKKDDG
ncbi:MAG: trigger factor [Planctomycetes bacterium]|nr:trigger factor [Planctomycetota bacterium]